MCFGNCWVTWGNDAPVGMDSDWDKEKNCQYKYGCGLNFEVV